MSISILSSYQKFFFLVSLCIITKTTTMMIVPNKESFYTPTEYAKNKLYYESCLRTAALDNNDTEMRKLIEIAKVNFHARDEVGNSALHYAAQTGSTKTGEILLQLGIDVNIQNNKRKTSLHIGMETARDSTFTTFIKLLLKYGADQTIKDGERIRPDYSVEFATGMSDTEKQFVKDAHKLFLYRRLEQLEIAQKDPTSKKKYENKLCAAAIGNKLATVIRLINNGVNINAKSNFSGDTALHYAVINGRLNIIRILLQSGADMNLQNDDGNTPLHLAVENRRFTEIIDLLLEFGADQSIKNNLGYRPDNSLANDFGDTPLERLVKKNKFLISVHQILLYARLQELAETENEDTLTLTVSFEHFPSQP